MSSLPHWQKSALSVFVLYILCFSFFFFNCGLATSQELRRFVARI